MRRAEALVHTAYLASPPSPFCGWLFPPVRPWSRSGTLPYHLCAACMLAAASIPLLLRRSEREAEEAKEAQLREGTAAAAG